MKRCPECNSDKIITDAIASNEGDGGKLRISVDEKPGNLIIKSRKYSDTFTQVCGYCGYIQLFAKDPNLLWSAYQNQKNSI